MAEGIAPLIMEIRAKASEVYTELGKVRSEFQKTATQTEADAKKTSESVASTGKAATKAAAETEGGTSRGRAAFHALAGAGKVLSIGLAGTAVTVGGAAIKMGMDFQEGMTSLVTGAGASEKTIGQVQSGILAMAGTVGMSTSQLTDGMYQIESAGYDAGKGLDVLKASAEGARVGNADLGVVAGGVTTALKDYHIPASQAAQVTSALIQTVADGKTHMQDLAGSLGNVMPLASQLGVKFEDVAGGLAQMTNQGMSAQNASQNLNHLIGALGADTMPKAAKALQSVGLSAQELNDGLKNKGLPETLQMVSEAVGKKFPAGSAAYMDAMRKILGGQPGLDAALMLTGKNLGDYQKKVEDVGEKLHSHSKDVEGFAETQKDLKTKLENAKDGAEAMVTALGMKLIPVVTAVIGKFTSFANVLMKHPALLYTLAGVIGGVVVVAVLAYAASMAAAAYATIAATWPILAIIAAVVAVGVAIYELATHWSTVWNAIKAAAGAVWDFLKGVWDWIAHTFMDGIRSGVRILEQEWSAAWNGVKSALSAVWGFIKMVFEAIVGTYLKMLETELHVLEAVWSAVWGGIKAATAAVWGFLQAVWSWISGIFGGAVHGVLNGLGAVWSRVWGGLRTVAADVWGFLQAVWGGIQSGINWVSNGVGVLGNVFRSVFGGIRSAVEGAWNVIKGIFDAISRAVGGVINTVGKVVSTIGSVAGKIGNFLGFDNGGIVPGPKGKPMLAVVHGGEYVLSNDMLAGRQEPTDLLNAQSANGYTAASSPSQQALTGSSPEGSGGGGPTVIVQAQTNASPQAIAKQVGWELRALA